MVICRGLVMTTEGPAVEVEVDGVGFRYPGMPPFMVAAGEFKTPHIMTLRISHETAEMLVHVLADYCEGISLSEVSAHAKRKAWQDRAAEGNRRRAARRAEPRRKK